MPITYSSNVTRTNPYADLVNLSNSGPLGTSSVSYGSSVGAPTGTLSLQNMDVSGRLNWDREQRAKEFAWQQQQDLWRQEQDRLDEQYRQRQEALQRHNAAWESILRGWATTDRTRNRFRQIAQDRSDRTQTLRDRFRQIAQDRDARYRALREAADRMKSIGSRQAGGDITSNPNVSRNLALPVRQAGSLSQQSKFENLMDKLAQTPMPAKMAEAFRRDVQAGIDPVAAFAHAGVGGLANPLTGKVADGLIDLSNQAGFMNQAKFGLAGLNYDTLANAYKQMAGMA